MPLWQVTAGTSLLLFGAGILILLFGDRRTSLVEAYLIWLLALLVFVVEYRAEPFAFQPLVEIFATMRNALSVPPVAAASICWALVVLKLFMALVEKNRRLFRAPAETIKPVVLGDQAEAPASLRLRRIADRILGEQNAAPAPAEPVLTAPEQVSDGGSAWRELLASRTVRDALQITPDELQALSGVAFMGEVVSVHDLRLVLQTIRSAQQG
jgi:hypothetical protein